MVWLRPLQPNQFRSVSLDNITNMSLFKKLPAELMVQLLRTLESPFDLRSFLTACPGAFQYFDFHHRHILQPYLDLVLEGVEHEFSILIAPRITRLRSIRHLLPSLEPAKAKAKVKQIDNLPELKPEEWQGNLHILCDLFCFVSEANDYIEHFILEIGLTPSRLLEEVKSDLRATFMEFEHCRHALFYDRSFLSTIICCEGVLWDPIHSKSIFSFVSAKYHRLVQRVDWHLRAVTVCNGESPDGKATMPNSEINSNRVWQFRQRIIHEELRYVAYLCFQGYGLLILLEKLDIKQLRHYILTTFLWACLHGARDESLGLSLERLYFRARKVSSIAVQLNWSRASRR